MGLDSGTRLFRAQLNSAVARNCAVAEHILFAELTQCRDTHIIPIWIYYSRTHSCRNATRFHLVLATPQKPHTPPPTSLWGPSPTRISHELHTVGEYIHKFNMRSICLNNKHILPAPPGHTTSRIHRTPRAALCLSVSV